MLCNTAAVTVNVAGGPTVLASVAVICDVPMPSPVARPVLPPIVAADIVPDAHVALLVRFCVLPSLKVPVAVNCYVSPFAIVGLPGVTAIDCSTAAVTVSMTGELTMLPFAAVISDVPSPSPVPLPVPEPIVATDGVPDAHTALVVTFSVLPSLYDPVAVNCYVVPAAIEGLAGVTAIDCSAAVVTVKIASRLIADPAALVTTAMYRAPSWLACVGGVV